MTWQRDHYASLTPLRSLFLLTTFVVVLTPTMIPYGRLIGTVYSQIPVSLSTVLPLHSYFSLTRREQVVVTRLYLRTCLLTHPHLVHWFTRSPPTDDLLVVFRGALNTCFLFALPCNAFIPACVDTALPHSFRSVLIYCHHVDFISKPLTSFLRGTAFMSSHQYR